MSNRTRTIRTCALALLAAGAMIGEASAQKCPTMRKINVGVAVAPPNVVHTAPYVAKALGLFAKHCIDANIIQFEGGQSQTANVAVAQGSAIISVNDVLVGRGMKVQQIWGLAPRMPQVYMVQEGITKPRAAQGQAALRHRRRRRRLQLAHGPRGAALGRPRRQRRAIHPVADRRAAAGPDRQPGRRGGAASGGRVPGAAAEADAESAGATRRPDAALYVQRLWRVDSPGSSATVRCCATRWRR